MATRAWDETDPANADEAKWGAQEIREHKQDTRERMEIDHVWNVSAADDGMHTRVMLYTPLGAHPTMAANRGVIYTYDVSAVAELHWRDESSNVVQLTSGGAINPGAIRNASATQDGLVELATDAEAQAKTDATRALTPDNLAALDASATFSGLVELSADAETDAGTDTTRAITPAQLQRKLGGSVVSGYNNTANRIHSDAGGHATSISLAGFTDEVWTDIGPTGATNVWTPLNSLPTTTSFIIVKVYIVQNGTTSGITYGTILYARANGSVATANQITAIAAQRWTNGSNVTVTHTYVTTAFIPVSSRTFDVYPDFLASTPSALTLILVGWG